MTAHSISSARATTRQLAAADRHLLARAELPSAALPPQVAPEAPEPRAVEQAFDAMVQRVLGRPSAGYEKVVPPRLRAATSALAVLTDPRGTAGAAMLATARAEGWVACVRDHGDTLASKRQGYGLGPLDGLLYRGHISPHEYWTASTVFALWRDSQGEPLAADETLGKSGEPVAFGGSYARWNPVLTFDLAVAEERSKALALSYSVWPDAVEEHTRSLGSAAEGWHQSPERFMYLLPLHIVGTYPQFGLVPFLIPLTPWNLCAHGSAVHLPVFSLSVFQHDLDFFYKQPLSAVPRLSTDPVSTLQRQVLACTRAAGISHGFPWSDRSKHLHADFLPTGEAGFAWHDLAHLNVGSADPPEARVALVRLHQHLSAHAKQLDLPERVGRFPFRKLFAVRLFGLTDQSRTATDLSVAEALARHTSSIVGGALSKLLVSGNAAEAANVRANFLGDLPSDTVFHTGLRGRDLESAKRHLGAKLRWQKDLDIPRLQDAWQHFTALQTRHAGQWLTDNGFRVTAMPQEERGIAAMATLRQRPPAPKTGAHLYNADVSLALDNAPFGHEYCIASLRARELTPNPFPPTMYWQHKGR